ESDSGTLHIYAHCRARGYTWILVWWNGVRDPRRADDNVRVRCLRPAGLTTGSTTTYLYLFKRSSVTSSTGTPEPRFKCLATAMNSLRSHASSGCGQLSKKLAFLNKFDDVAPFQPKMRENSFIFLSSTASWTALPYLAPEPRKPGDTFVDTALAFDELIQ